MPVPSREKLPVSDSELVQVGVRLTVSEAQVREVKVAIDGVEAVRDAVMLDVVLRVGIRLELWDRVCDTERLQVAEAVTCERVADVTDRDCDPLVVPVRLGTQLTERDWL